jgi:sugar lactone lactonase YvrE
MSIAVERAVRCGDKLGESAFWDARRGRLWWVNIPPASLLHWLDPVSGETHTFPMPEMVTCVRAARDGETLIAACHSGLARIDAKTGALTRLFDPEPGKPFNRCNDGATDPRGRFWFGTMQNNVAPDGSDYALIHKSGTLYRLDADLTATPFETEIGVSNSTAFSPDGKTMYFCDTTTGVINAYDYDLDAGVPSRKRAFATFERGFPDGAAIDADGGLWSARWDGGCVARFTPDGKVDRVVDLPIPKITSCAFGGADLDLLFITTSRNGMSEAEIVAHPEAGDLFVCRPGVKGVAAVEFG